MFCVGLGQHPLDLGLKRSDPRVVDRCERLLVVGLFTRASITCAVES